METIKKVENKNENKDDKNIEKNEKENINLLNKKTKRFKHKNKKKSKNKNMNIWKVIVDDVLSFTLKNENAAKRLSALIKKDMKNYAKVRWGGLAQWL